MKGKYITEKGESVEVLDYDAANKMAYIKTSEGETKWIGEIFCQGWWSESKKPQPVIEEAKVVEVPKVEEVKAHEPEPEVVVEEKKTEKPAVQKGKKK